MRQRRRLIPATPETQRDRHRPGAHTPGGAIVPQPCSLSAQRNVAEPRKIGMCSTAPCSDARRMSVMPLDTLIVGSGHARLAMSEHLSGRACLSSSSSGLGLWSAGRSGRWDSPVAGGPSEHDRFPSMTLSRIAQEHSPPTSCGLVHRRGRESAVSGLTQHPTQSSGLISTITAKPTVCDPARFAT
jgi:hypothetical protein